VMPADDQLRDCHAQSHAEGGDISAQMPIGPRAADHDGDTDQGDHTGYQRSPCFHHAKATANARPAVRIMS
jgi:hypothetical protein